MSKKVKSSQVFEDRRAGFVITDPAGNMHVRQFTDSGDVVLGDGSVGSPPAAPAAPHAPEHGPSGSDPLDILTLDGYSGDPDDVLHGDATWGPVTGSSDGNWVPLALGTEPLEFVSDTLGQPIYVWYAP